MRNTGFFKLLVSRPVSISAIFFFLFGVQAALFIARNFSFLYLSIFLTILPPTNRSVIKLGGYSFEKKKKELKTREDPPNSRNKASNPIDPFFLREDINHVLYIYIYIIRIYISYIYIYLLFSLLSLILSNYIIPKCVYVEHAS